MDVLDSSSPGLIRQLGDPDEQRRQKAMWQMYIRFMPGLYTYGRRRLLSDADATSAAHDTLLRVSRRCHTYDASKGSVEGWIYKIHQRIVIDWLRKTPPVFLEELQDSYPTPQHTLPEQYVESKENLECIRRAWNRLDESNRRILYQLQQKRKRGPKSQACLDALEQFRTLIQEEMP